MPMIFLTSRKEPPGEEWRVVEDARSDAMRLEQDLLEALTRQDALRVSQSARAPAPTPPVVPALEDVAFAGGAPAYGAVVLFSGERQPQASLDTVLAAYHDGMA